LTHSVTTGSAGESTLIFSASSTLDGRTAEVLIQSGGKTQRINIIQGLSTISTATCADVIAGPDSKTYQVTGVCTSIDNTIYGNWYLTDNTGKIYIYGTLDKKGQTKNFLSLGLEVGDEVTVQGPKTTYGTTIELVNVTVIKINKSLVKVDSIKNAALPLEGGEITAYLTCKGQGVSVDIPEDAKSWLSISSIQTTGTNTVMKFKAIANIGGDRGTTLTFSTTDGSKNYSSQTTISQKGSILKASIAEFNAAVVSTTQYRLSGVITSIPDATSGKLNLRDFSGEVYVYKIQDFASKGLKVGDIITIVGTRAAYNGTPQVNGAVLESSISVTTASIADVLTKTDDPNTYFKVTGVIKSIANAIYGNLTIQDGNSEIYVYGCYPGYGATGDFRKDVITAKSLKVGDTLTVIAPKGSYNGVAQLMNSIYFSHVSAQ
ncbi:MAG: BACON domain-containing protein, partial [Paludibacter sp.]